MSVALRYAARSHLGLGTKSRNEDSAYAGPELLVLCDGMGGHAAGDVASSLVVGELVHLDGESHGGDDMISVLETSVLEANDRLAEVADETETMEGMGTTCIAMLRSGSKLAVANIGDSRAYLRRGTRVTQITKDHSFVQKLLDEGRITEEEGLHHPQRSLVTRVLTGRDGDQPDLSMRELRIGDRLLLCSDGLTDYVAESTVADLLLEDSPPGSIADRLIEISLRASVRDNVTVIVADVVPPGEGTTNPQVVGAASERRGTQILPPQTPAEKAAALTREVRGEGGEGIELAEEGPPSGLVSWLRRGLIGVAILLVLAAGTWATYDWSQRQYFVGEESGRVAIFKGVSQDLGPVDLSQPVTVTDIEVTALPTYYQQQVRASLSADDLVGAGAIVSELRTLALPRCEELTVPLPTSSQDSVTVTVGPDGRTLTAAPDTSRRTAGPGDTDAATATQDQGPIAVPPTEDCRP